MTAKKLRDMAGKLANSCWCRYWLFWDDEDNPTMAIQCIQHDGEAERIIDIEPLGFKEGPNFIYTIKRTNEDGTPYIRTTI